MKTVAMLGCVAVFVCLCIQPGFGKKEEALPSAVNPGHDSGDHPHEMNMEKISHFIRRGHLADNCEVEFEAGQECELPVPLGPNGVYDACCNTATNLACKGQSDGSYKCVEITTVERSRANKAEVMWAKLKRAYKAAERRRLGLKEKLKIANTNRNDKRNHDHKHLPENRAPHGGSNK